MLILPSVSKILSDLSLKNERLDTFIYNRIKFCHGIDRSLLRLAIGVFSIPCYVWYSKAFSHEVVVID